MCCTFVQRKSKSFNKIAFRKYSYTASMFNRNIFWIRFLAFWLNTYTTFYVSWMFVCVYTKWILYSVPIYVATQSILWASYIGVIVKVICSMRAYLLNAIYTDILPVIQVIHLLSDIQNFKKSSTKHTFKYALLFC